MYLAPAYSCSSKTWFTDMVLGPVVLFLEKHPLEINGVLPDWKDQINTFGRIGECNWYCQLILSTEIVVREK